MSRSQRSLATVFSLALGLGVYGCQADEDDNNNTNSERGGTGGSNSSAGSGGSSSGGAGGSSTAGSGGSSSAGSGGAMGGAGGSAGGAGGATTKPDAGGVGGAGGMMGDAGMMGGAGGMMGGAGGAMGGAGGMGMAPAAGPLKLTVHEATMDGDRNCYADASNDRGNKSPKMDWGPAPEGTKSWTLTTYDITGTSAHMVICDIPASVAGFEADIKTMVPEGAQWSVGHGNKRNVGWYGPGAGGSPRHYEIEIWAIPTEKIAGGCNDARAFHTRLRSNANNKELVLGSAKWDFWGNAQGRCR